MEYNERCLWDLIVYGSSYTKTIVRSWYNPLRWIKGRYYKVRIDPKDIYL